jgi:hypothetical protein
MMTFPILSKPIHFTVVGQTVAFCRVLALAFSSATLYLQNCTLFCRLGGTAAGLKGTPWNSQDEI